MKSYLLFWGPKSTRRGRDTWQILRSSRWRKGFPGGSLVKNLPAKQETRVQSLGREDPLEKGMAAHSIILARRIPWTAEPGGLQFMGSQKSQAWPGDWTATRWRKPLSMGEFAELSSWVALGWIWILESDWPMTLAKDKNQGEDKLNLYCGLYKRPEILC